MTLVKNAPIFKGLALPYMEKSYVMSGNYSRGYNFTLESEAHQVSRGKVNPV